MQQTTTANLGFVLAKASQRWNELLADAFRRQGYPEVRPAYGSVLLPLWEEDGLQMTELARRAHLSKQTLTTLVPSLETTGLVMRTPDPADRRAQRVYLTPRGRELRPVAEQVLGALDAAVAALLTPAQVSQLTQGLQAVLHLDLPATGSGGNQ